MSDLKREADMQRKQRWMWITLISVVGLLGTLLLVRPSQAGLPAAITPVPTPNLVFLPLVQGGGSGEPTPDPTAHHILLRPDNVYLSRSGETFTDTFTGPIEHQVQPLSTGAWNQPPNPYSANYKRTRGYLSYDLGDLAGKTVVSAALELYRCASATPGQTENTTLTLHAGEWTGEVTADAWDKVGDIWGTVTFLPTQKIADGDEWLSLPLQGTLPDKLHFVWKADETQSYAYSQSVGGSFDLADCYSIGDDAKLTTLHLWIEE
jgi:hypothetical protein